MQLPVKETFGQKWRNAFRSPIFIRKFIGVVLTLTIIFSIFPWFFQSIEKRHGVVLNDWLLRILPAHNVSVPIFIVIWSVTFYGVYRLIQTPEHFVSSLWVYAFVCLSRIISISITPLDPPVGILALADPLANKAYGAVFITKDLFYSGHTSSMFIIFLCLRGKIDKMIALAGTFIVGFLLLVQHVHYTLDVISAPFFTYFIYWLTPKLISPNSMNKGKHQNASPN